MKISEEFPSKWLKASDLGGKEVKVIMQNVEREDVGDGIKPVLYFKGRDRGVVLNKTNATRISDYYGDDTDDWFDEPLILYSEMATFAGKTGPAIRVRVPTPKDNKRKDDSISTAPERGDFPGDRPLDDDITF